MKKVTHKKNYWLIKSEPTSYSIADLQRDKKTPWTGIRNYLARNYMRDGMKVGDLILFYHSSCAVPGVAGIAQVASAPYPDPTQFDPKDYHYEPRAMKEKPVWYMVDISFIKKYPEVLSLLEMRKHSELHGMQLLRSGNRLSITPVQEAEFLYVQKLLA